MSGDTEGEELPTAPGEGSGDHITPATATLGAGRGGRVIAHTAGREEEGGRAERETLPVADSRD